MAVVTDAESQTVVLFPEFANASFYRLSRSLNALSKCHCLACGASGVHRNQEKNPRDLIHQGIEPFGSPARYRRVDQEMYCNSDDCDQAFGLLACIEGRYIDCGDAIAYTPLSENMRCDTCWEDFFKVETERGDCNIMTETMYASPHTTRPCWV